MTRRSRRHAGLDLDALRQEVLPRLRRAVAIDALWLATVDPATLLFTRTYREEIPENTGPYFVKNEFLDNDVNKWVELARDRRGARTLADATSGRLDSSPRYRDIFKPLGLGDELRVVLRLRGVCWGYMCLHRENGSQFSASETAYMRQLSSHLAEGIRAGMLLSSLDVADPAGSPGLVILAADGSMLTATPPGERWLEELGSRDHSLPLEFHVVAARLRCLEPSDESVPRLRVRTTAGRWAVLHACWMPAAGDGAIAIVAEEARPAEVAPIVMMAYGLTEHERIVTGLSCQGLSTREISERLHVSPHTVHDHLKRIFDKTGVRSRRELVATILSQQYMPRAMAGKQLGPSGFYAE